MREKIFRFPGFKYKALTLSYDDGTIYDKKLIEIMSKYGIRGTFNLSTTFFRDCWGLPTNLSTEEAKALYYPSGNEVAIHGDNHWSLTKYPADQMVAEVYECRKGLEQLFGGIIRGMAYANGAYNDEVAECLKMLGVKYSRTCDATHDFCIRDEWLKLRPTCHHDDEALFDLADKFLSWDIEQMYVRDSILFYVWGHSYEFEHNDNWARIEEFCQKVGGNEGVWYATNMEIYDYIQAYKKLEFSVDGVTIHNPTAIDIYFECERKNYLVKAGEMIQVD